MELKQEKMLLKLSDLCQIVSGTGVIRKFHEFLKSHFWGDFDVWPKCAPPPPRTTVTAAWRAAQLSWPRPQVSALSHPSSGARGTHWLLQSAFWLLLLTAEAATRVLDRVSELEGFYIDANDGFRYSHLSNNPPQYKNPPSTFIDFLDFSTLHSSFIRVMY